MSNPRTIIATGAFMAFLAILAGAFGAHGLKDTLTAYEMGVFKTGASYHLIHALGLILIGILTQQSDDSRLLLAALFMFIGILLFSGSLYALSLTGIRSLGMITPVGGAFFLTAWLVVCLSFLKQKQE